MHRYYQKILEVNEAGTDMSHDLTYPYQQKKVVTAYNLNA